MRGRSYIPSPSPPPPRSYRRWSPSPRGHFGRPGREDLPTSLLVRNLRQGWRDKYDANTYKLGYTGSLVDLAFFVQYIDPADAAEAKYQMDGQILLGRELTVVFAEENRKRPADMRARENMRGRSYDRRSSRYSHSLRYSRLRSPRYSRSPRRGRSGFRSGSYYSPSLRRREYSRSMSPEDRKHHSGRSYSRSPYGSRSRSPYEDERREGSRSRSPY